MLHGMPSVRKSHRSGRAGFRNFRGDPCGVRPNLRRHRPKIWPIPAEVGTTSVNTCERCGPTMAQTKSRSGQYEFAPSWGGRWPNFGDFDGCGSEPCEHRPASRGLRGPSSGTSSGLGIRLAAKIYTLARRPVHVSSVATGSKSNARPFTRSVNGPARSTDDDPSGALTYKESAPAKHSPLDLPMATMKRCDIDLESTPHIPERCASGHLGSRGQHVFRFGRTLLSRRKVRARAKI